MSQIVARSETHASNRVVLFNKEYKSRTPFTAKLETSPARGLTAQEFTAAGRVLQILAVTGAPHLMSGIWMVVMY